MRAHSQRDIHMQSCEVELAATRAMKEGSIIQQLQHVGEQEKLKNRTARKALLRCTHFLARNYIAHTTNFDKLIECAVVETTSSDSLRVLEEMLRTLLKTLLLSLLRQSASGLKNIFLSVFIRRLFTA